MQMGCHRNRCALAVGPFVVQGLAEAQGSLMESLGMLGPGSFLRIRHYRTRLRHRRARFYFTEKGWHQVGRHVVAEAKRRDQVLRTRHVPSAGVGARNLLYRSTSEQIPPFFQNLGQTSPMAGN